MSNELWVKDEIQFPRLIAELESCEVFDDQLMTELATRMDLSCSDVGMLIDRAIKVFERVKLSLLNPVGTELDEAAMYERPLR